MAVDSGGQILWCDSGLQRRPKPVVLEILRHGTRLGCLQANKPYVAGRIRDFNLQDARIQQTLDDAGEEEASLVVKLGPANRKQRLLGQSDPRAVR